MADNTSSQSRFTFSTSRGSNEPVECLGLKFERDHQRRAHFVTRLAESLDKARQAGTPKIGEVDLSRLANPPYYTPYPNPFLAELLAWWGKESPQEEKYHREPFSTDVSAGKNDPLYEAFSCHTKVPPKAIQAYIEHYCPPNGVVMDGFCGSGMTGLAARLSGRKAVLFDLSPAATAIAAGYTLPVARDDLQAAAQELIKNLKVQCAWLYEVSTDGSMPATLDYMIWSEQYRCANCQAEFLFADIGFNFETSGTVDVLHCPACDAQIDSDHLERCLDHTGKTIEKPVRVKYLSRKRNAERTLDVQDLELLKRIETEPLPFLVPEDYMMNIPPGDKGWGDMWRRGYHSGMWKVSDFFYKRTLWCLAAVLDQVEKLDVPPNVRTVLRTAVVNSSGNMTRMRRAYQGVLPLVLYMPRMRREVNVIEALETKLERLVNLLGELPQVSAVAVSTQSSTHLTNLPSASIDYIFTDPPFGDNIIYSEVNFIWESLLRAYTAQESEAIMSRYQGKRLLEYQGLMTACFSEFCRVLKPGRWMTVEFHNSKNSIWNAIQDALQAAGFVVADVRILDKQQGSFKQVSTAGAVKQDLVISAYKPSQRLEQNFELNAGSEAAVWEFVREHLSHLPVYVEKENHLEVVAERQNYLLFDRMVAYHVQHQVAIPLSASEFYAGLVQRFPERDGMFFLPEQVGQYDQKRVAVHELAQLPLFINDEASAIQWIRQQLNQAPQTMQDLHPKFIRELSGWQKNEQSVELMDILKENFLLHIGGMVPGQVWAWLEQNPEWAGKVKDQSPQTAPAEITEWLKDRWYVPDPNHAQDLEKLRERGLLREFEHYCAPGTRALKVFRLEAVRVGFRKAWQEKDYGTIIKVAQKIPENVLQEDPKLLMWYDQALTRSGQI